MSTANDITARMNAALAQGKRSERLRLRDYGVDPAWDLGRTTVGDYIERARMKAATFVRTYLDTVPSPEDCDRLAYEEDVSSTGGEVSADLEAMRAWRTDAPAPAPAPALRERSGNVKLGGRGAPDVAGLLGMPYTTFRYRYLSEREPTLADLEALALVLEGPPLRVMRDLILARGQD